MKTLVVLLCLVGLVAQARLGERETELTARYGEPSAREVRDGAIRCSYETDEHLRVVAIFVAERCVEISYWFEARNIEGKTYVERSQYVPREMSVAERQDILAANARKDADWIEDLAPESGTLEWHQGGGEARRNAQYIRATHRMVIGIQAYKNVGDRFVAQAAAGRF